MKKRVLTGVIVVFLALAGQDVLKGGASRSATVVPKISSPETTATEATSTEEKPIVTRVVDGDTIVVRIGGISEKVRLIGVDTPETVDPRRPVQCFGKEASAFTRALLLNNSIRLEVDTSQGGRDKYGRLLRYVFLLDNTLVNEKIIAEGYGHEYTYRIPYRHQTDFKSAERNARENKKGLWADNVCGATK